jgi:radical SAM protein with 4Fe4S-binding SPASM domain
MAAYAKEKGVKEVSFLTNSLVIDNDYARRLAEIKVDYISVSIDGVYEDYERIRKPATFDGILRRLEDLKEIRDTIGKGYPRIKVNTIWTKVKDRIDDYYKIFSPLADIISFNPDYDYTQEATEIDPDHICQYPWQRFTVKWNGDVPMCISDWDSEVILGNITKSTIFEIWNGDKMNQIRQDQQNHRIRNYAPCRKCHRPVTEQIGDIRPTKK